MARRVIDNIREIADQLRDQAAEAERLGRMPDDTAKLLKAAGPIKLLQPKQYGGFEAHPREFAETVMAVASLDGAAGWICGVVGVHPWQLAFADPKVREEVWGADDNTWMASPYAPTGIAVPTDGGYLVQRPLAVQFRHRPLRLDFPRRTAGQSRRQHRRPADHAAHDPAAQRLPDRRRLLECGGAEGDRLQGHHRPRRLRAVVPGDERRPGHRRTAQKEAGVTESLYKMPWSNMFPLGITAAVIGISEGALAAHLDYQRGRVGAQGTAIKDDPYVLFAISEAASDINAARQELLANVDKMWDIVESGRDVSFEERAVGRRTQIRAAWRAVMAVDQIFARSGGNAARMDKPLQRFWRDAHVGLNHAIHVPSTVYHAAALSSMGIEPADPLRAMI